MVTQLGKFSTSSIIYLELMAELRNINATEMKASNGVQTAAEFGAKPGYLFAKMCCAVERLIRG